MKFPSLICLEQLLSPPHTQAEVRSRARAITDLVTSVVLQEETTHGTCARVWALTALSYPHLLPRETPQLHHHCSIMVIIWKATCLTCFCSHSAGPEGLYSICCSAGYSQPPRGAVSRHGSQHGQWGCPQWEASSLDPQRDPMGSPCPAFLQTQSKPKSVAENEASGFSRSVRPCEDTAVLTGQVKVNSLHEIYAKWNGEVVRRST